MSCAMGGSPRICLRTCSNSRRTRSRSSSGMSAGAAICAVCIAIRIRSDTAYTGELTHEEGLRLIDDLAAFGAPVLLFSGGEPLMHARIF